MTKPFEEKSILSTKNAGKNSEEKRSKGERPLGKL
jgi:hypothetical protein